MNNVKKAQTLLRKSVTITPEKSTYFFKMGVGEYAHNDRFLGVTIPNVRAIAKIFTRLSLEEIHALLTSPFNEERFFALIILNYQYKKGDVQTKENIYRFYLNNLQYINNWNLVDASAHLIVGAHLLNGNKDILLNLAQSSNLWERRIAIVATWYFIRNKDLEWTFIIAKLLLNDTHDLIHKAVGWMLREAGKKNMYVLIAFLDKHRHHMPRTMLRYAIEKFSPETRKTYLLL